MKALPVAVLAALTSFASAADLVGKASVIDGDTIEIHGERIRLWGIDALESNQLCRDADSKHYQCGRLPANALAALFTTSLALLPAPPRVAIKGARWLFASSESRDRILGNGWSRTASHSIGRSIQKASMRMNSAVRRRPNGGSGEVALSSLKSTGPAGGGDGYQPMQ